MCIAIYKPAGKSLAPEDLQAAHWQNPDGCGFTVRDNDRLTTHKGLWTFPQFWQRWEQHSHQEAIVHFRLATAGTIARENCHPFQLSTGASLIHNGHLRGYGTRNSSDTRHWIESTLNPLLAHFPTALAHPGMVAMLEQFLGHSKVVILPKRGPVIILNEALGVWENECWYSNADLWESPWWQAPQQCALCQHVCTDARFDLCENCDWLYGDERVDHTGNLDDNLEAVV